MAFIVNFVTNNFLPHIKRKNNNNNIRYHLELVITAAFHQPAGRQLQTHGLAIANPRDAKCKFTGCQMQTYGLPNANRRAGKWKPAGWQMETGMNQRLTKDD